MKARTENKVMNVFIGFLVVINITLFFVRMFDSKKPQIVKINQESHSNSNLVYTNTPRNLPPPPPEIEYSEEELKEAITKLNLPTWSRSYVPCTSNESEVTCSQIVRAWRVIHNYENYIHNTPFKDRKHYIFDHENRGVGNRFSIDASNLLICLFSNRSYIYNATHPENGDLDSPGQAYITNPIAIEYSTVLNESLQIGGTKSWFISPFYNTWTSFKPNIYRKFIRNNELIYMGLTYTHPEIGKFAMENFGIHAGYFLSNYLSRLTNESMEEAKRVYANVPRGTRVIGVHLRFHLPGQFYSHNITSTMNAVSRFLDEKLKEKPTMFAFASDNQDMENAFKQKYGRYTITTNSIRIPDYDHNTALYDLALLEMADELLLTYRSTFSYVVSMRTLKRAYFVEKEAPDVFQLGNSQAGGISPLFHNYDVNDWQLNRRVFFSPNAEDQLRNFTKYLLL